MSENEENVTPGAQPPPPQEGAGQPAGEEGLLTPEELATLSPAEQRALARKRLAERIRATIPDEQRRMTKRSGAQAIPGEPVPTTPPPQAPTMPPAAPPPARPEPPTAGTAGPPSPVPPAAPPAPEVAMPPQPSETQPAPPQQPRRRPRPPEGRPARKPPAGRGARPKRPETAGLVPAVAARPTNLPTRAKEPSKVHPVGVAVLIVLALGIAYFFADIWGLFFVPLLLVFLWRKVDSRELLGITAVMVASIPLIMVIQGIDLGGNIDSSYALKQMLAHAVAGIAIGLLAIACVVAAVDWRYRVLPLDPAGDPNDEPVLVSFLPSRKGIGARVVAKATPLKQEGPRV